MVRLLCLDDADSEEPAATGSLSAPQPAHGDGRPNPNIHHGFAAALSCYPIVSQLATQLDLNSLHELSRTCRQIRANLLQYRDRLIAQTLRCVNETTSPALRLGNALNASFASWTTYGRNGATVGHITSGKVGACARDLVGACRKCGEIICRNCILKSPTPTMLRGRHRRLCRTCMKSPIDRMTTYVPDPGLTDDDAQYDSSLTTFARSPCTCSETVWVCSPCGQAVRAADTIYMRGWSWRTRYSTCGGFGAGLGEGVEGVECGRGARCSAASQVEQEVECDAGELAAIEAEMEKAQLDGHGWVGTSYTTQEMVGIGGQVKKKVKKMVVVGAAVKEYEDERADGSYLRREQTGVNRSWCSWCARAVPSKKDIGRPVMSTDSITSCSSCSSTSSGASA